MELNDCRIHFCGRAQKDIMTRTKKLLFLVILILLVGCRRQPAEVGEVTPTPTVESPASLKEEGAVCNRNQECASCYCHFSDISTKMGVCGVPSQMTELLLPNGEERLLDFLNVTIQDGSIDIGNDVLHMNVVFEGMVMAMTDTRTGQQRMTGYLDGFNHPEIIQAETQVLLLYHFDGSPDVGVVIEMEGDSVYLSLKMERDTATEGIDFPGGIQTQTGEWLVLPLASGVIVPVNEVDLWGFSFFTWKSSMNFLGVLDAAQETGFLMRMEESWSSEAYFENNNTGDPIAIYPVHLPEHGVFSQMRHMTFTFIESGGYVTMAHKQREYAEQAGFVKTFNEKIEENPNVEKLIGAVDFHLGCGNPWVIEELPLFGIDKALINFHGGYYVSEAEQCPTDIQIANKLGFLTGRYDIFTDVWNPAEIQDDWVRTEGYPQDVIVTEDGSLQEGWVHVDENGSYQGYYTSSATHIDHGLLRIEADLAANPYTARFLDVELASSLIEDYSESHPATREADMYYRMQALSLLKDGFNLVTGSEEFHEWALPFLDYSEGTMTIVPEENAGYDWATPVTEVSADYLKFNISPYYRIPLEQLVYHDSHVTTWYTGDGASKVPSAWDDKDLFNALYGSMPLFLPPDIAYWVENRLRFIDSYYLAAMVFRETGTAKMIDHRILTDDRLVQETEFENGWVVTVNFGNAPYADARYPFALAPKGMFATDGTHVISRVVMGGGTTIYVHMADRMYLHPAVGGVEYAGFRTSDSVLLLWGEDGDYQLNLLSGQRRVQINTETIPMKLYAGHFEDINGDVVTYKDLGNNWIEVMVDVGTDIIRWVNSTE